VRFPNRAKFFSKLIQLAASQYRKQGLQKINERKYKEAIAAFTEAIKVSPGESSDHQNRGTAKEMLLSQSWDTTL